MNTDNLVQMMQKGFHVTLGAASFLVDTAVTPNQDQRNNNLSKLQSGNFETLTEEWAITGEQKEQEARTFMESVIPSGSFPGGPIHQSTMPQKSTTKGPHIPTDIQQDLESIMTELSEIRTTLKNDE